MSVNQSNMAKNGAKTEDAPDRLIWQDRSKTALVALAKSALADMPVVVLTGVTGAGKTTFLEKVASNFGKGCLVRALRIVDGKAKSLRTAVCASLEIKNDFKDDPGAIAGISKALFDLDAANKKLVILIDDADGLDDAALDLLGQIAVIQRKKRYLPRIVVAGSMELFERIKTALGEDSAALIDNISVPALTREASFKLIKNEAEHQSKGKITIEDAACASIYRETNGVPGPTMLVTQKIVKKAKAQKINVVNMRNVRELMPQEKESLDPAKLTANAAKAREPGKNPSRPTADVVGGADQLPKSIRESEDPQQLLRWAMGIRNKPEDSSGTAPTANAATPTMPGTQPNGQAKPSTAPVPPPVQPDQSAAAPRSQMAPLPDKILGDPASRASSGKPAVAPAGFGTSAPKKPNAVIGSSEQFQFKADEPLAAERDYKAPSNSIADPSTLVPELKSAKDAQKKARPFGAALFIGGLLLGGAGAAALSALQGQPNDTVAEVTGTTQKPSDPVVVATNPLDQSTTDFGNNSGVRQGTLTSVPSDLPPSGNPGIAVRAPEPVPGFIGENQTVVVSTLDGSAESVSRALTRENEAARAELARITRAVESAKAELAAAESARTRIDLETKQSKSELDLAQQNAESAKARLGEISTQVSERRAELSQILQDLASGQLSASNTAAETDSRSAAAQERLALVNAETAQAETSLRSARTLLDTITSDVDVARKELATLSETISASEIAAAEQETRLTTVQDEKAEAERALANATADLTQTQSQLAETQQAVATLQSERETALTEFASLEQKATDATQLVDQTGARLGELESEIATLQSNRTALTQEIATLRSERANLTTQTSVLDDQSLTLNAQQAEILQSVEAAQVRKEKLETEIASLMSNLMQLRSEKQQTESAIANLPDDLDDRVARADRLNSELDIVTEDLANQAVLRAELNIEIDEILQRSLAAQKSLSRTQDRIQERRDQLIALDREIENAIENAPRGTLASLPALRGRQSPNETDDATLSASLEPAPNAASIAAQDLAPNTQTGFIPRDAVVVETALSRAPGLSGLEERQIDELQTRIAEGECLTDALQGVTGTINRHTLAVLLRSLTLCTNR